MTPFAIYHSQFVGFKGLNHFMRNLYFEIDPIRTLDILGFD